MSGPDILSEKKPVLGINGLGSIGKLSVWYHIARKYFREIVVNQGRGIGLGMDAVAQTIEKDSTYGLMHTFLYGIHAPSVIKIVDERRGKMLIDGIPVTVLREARNPREIPWRDHGVEVVAGARASSSTRRRTPTARRDQSGDIISPAPGSC